MGNRMQLLEELRENISRLEHTIGCGHFQEGYIANCKADLESYRKALVKEKERLFKKVWSKTHSDYRGKLDDGSLSIMSWAKYGGGLVTASCISVDELLERSR
jgi:hypothetical protein